MSQIAARSGTGAHMGHEPAHVAARRELDLNAVTLAPGATSMLSNLFLIAGLLFVAALVVTSWGGDIAHAMAAYHMGFMYCVGLAVACLGMQMIFQQFNAGWAAAVRRQAENISSCVWVCALLFVPIVVLEMFFYHGKLFHWMDPSLTDPLSSHYDTLAVKKQAFLNPAFWLVRAGIYFAIWIFLATKLGRMSREQDRTGDKWLTARARRISSVGLLLFALTAAFASFDWLMSLDYHWFSTMFGVYFFAGAIRAAVALITIILCVLMIRGKLGAAFTKEHLHDTGKLLFAFTVFWAYITFCQYFLIWYSNIPEETAWYNARVSPAWQPFPAIMVAFNFVLPFLLLLVRVLKRNPRTLAPIALICMIAYAMDLYFVVRAMIGAAPWDHMLIDFFGLLGPLCLFLGVVIRKIGTAPLIPLKDPRLHEVLGHKNYV